MTELKRRSLEAENYKFKGTQNKVYDFMKQFVIELVTIEKRTNVCKSACYYSDNRI